jgi:hypothetical protein
MRKAPRVNTTRRTVQPQSWQPIAIAVPVQESTLQVVAPSNMEGGYEFFVNAGNHKAYKVRVPDEGAVVG